MMSLAVVAVAVMTVVGGVSTMVMVEEVATAAAEVADDGRGRWRLCSVIYFSPFFFLNVIAAATEV